MARELSGILAPKWPATTNKDYTTVRCALQLTNDLGNEHRKLAQSVFEKGEQAQDWRGSFGSARLGRVVKSGFRIGFSANIVNAVATAWSNCVSRPAT